MVKATFPEQPKTACAIAYGESLNNPSGINYSQVEHSVGVMQINLFAWDSKRNVPLPPRDEIKNLTWEQIQARNPLAKRVHWDKAQGNTLEEKTKFLQNPTNNIQVGRVIFAGKNNAKMHFGDWSAYSNQSYKNHLDKCK